MIWRTKKTRDLPVELVVDGDSIETNNTMTTRLNLMFLSICPFQISAAAPRRRVQSDPGRRSVTVPVEPSSSLVAYFTVIKSQATTVVRWLY